MNITLLQAQMTLQEVTFLLKEFPQYLFLSLSEASYATMSAEHWSRLEILYGARLTKEELAKAPQLKWIHCPGPHLSRLCMEEIEKRGNILVSNTVDENIPQIGEYAMAGILAFAKNLFAWKEINRFPGLLWDSKCRDTMWTLKNRVLLQIGLGKVGTEIARRGKEMGMKVWGVQQRSFHPCCHKMFSMSDLHSILPEADVVSIAPLRGEEYYHLFKKEELALMKNDSILVVIGASTTVDEEALAFEAKSGKFRGILLDANYQTPIPIHSPLWKIPNIIITPEVSPRPKSTERLAFKLFVYNYRQYLHGNFKDMRNIIEQKTFFLA
jgi:phosphoglycerate dehydrogenase-like enzyme